MQSLKKSKKIRECKLRMKREFKVGDRVRIRQWDDMEKEFGLSCLGVINCHNVFIDDMKSLCGKTALITRMNEQDVFLENNCLNLSCWSYSTDMLEHIEEPEKLTLEFDPTNQKASHEALSKMIEEYKKEQERKSREWTQDELDEAVRLIKELSVEVYSEYDSFPTFYYSEEWGSTSVLNWYGDCRVEEFVRQISTACSKDDVFSVDIGRCVALHKLLQKPIPDFIMNKGKE